MLGGRKYVNFPEFLYILSVYAVNVGFTETLVLNRHYQGWDYNALKISTNAIKNIKMILKKT